MSYNEQMQSLWSKFEVVHGQEPTTTKECFEWAFKEGLWKPRPIDIAKIFNKEMADALRQEYRVDPSGRKYRAKVCVKEKVGSGQMTLWADADKVSEQMFHKSAQQRRKGIVGDSYQLKQDVDHFNEYRSPIEPFNLILDFTDDVAEIEIVNHPDRGCSKLCVSQPAFIS